MLTIQINFSANQRNIITRSFESARAAAAFIEHFLGGQDEMHFDDPGIFSWGLHFYGADLQELYDFLALKADLEAATEVA